ncbi:MAG: sugar ABC transporter permease [Alphaproteobacteria bacterium]
MAEATLRAGPARRRRPVGDGVICAAFLSPTLLVLLLMVAYPLLSLIEFSFQRFSALRPNQPAEDVGLFNYEFLLTDPDLWSRFQFTGRYVVVAVAVQFLLGVIVAYQFQRRFTGRDVLFTVLMIPMMICPIVVGFLWKYMFNSEWGIVNWLVTLLGGDKIDWLGVTDNALWAVVIADTWMWTPFIILLAAAAFRSIPRAIYEAAEIDGASAAFVFFRITVPISAPILFIALLLRLIDCFKQYDLFFALTGGGPGSSTETVSFALGKTAFSYFYTGEASALAMILLIVIIGLSLVLVRFLNGLSRRARGES